MTKDKRYKIVFLDTSEMEITAKIVNYAESGMVQFYAGDMRILVLASGQWRYVRRLN
jgi:hypothetical protein